MVSFLNAAACFGNCYHWQWQFRHPAGKLGSCRHWWWQFPKPAAGLGNYRLGWQLPFWFPWQLRGRMPSRIGEENLGSFRVAVP